MFRNQKEKQFGMPLFVVLVLVLVTLACGGEVSPTKVGEVPSPLPTKEEPAAEPTANKVPEEAPAPTDTPVPTNTPEPIPVEPTVLLELEGTGETITDNFEWPACQKAVFYWTSAVGQYGSASLIVDLHKVGAEREVNLINEFEMDAPSEGTSGAALQPLDGGEYYFSTENTDNPWTLRVECQDGQVADSAGIDIQGIGNTVTHNYKLPVCQKSVFLWSVEPNSGGTASLILDLYKVGEERSITLVNEFAMDVTEPLAGEALQQLSEGYYYLTIENLSGPWAIRWECRD
jgi:hypothetical protein